MCAYEGPPQSRPGGNGTLRSERTSLPIVGDVDADAAVVGDGAVADFDVVAAVHIDAVVPAVQQREADEPNPRHVHRRHHRRPHGHYRAWPGDTGVRLAWVFSPPETCKPRREPPTVTCKLDKPREVAHRYNIMTPPTHTHTHTHTH